MESFSLPSFAKINLMLRVLGRRPDGYHELFTVFQTISLHDTLTFTRSDTLELTCDEPSIPVDGQNLIIRAAMGLERVTGKSITGKIHLQKRIPSPGGLGGGSSNAFVAAWGLARLCDIHIQASDLRTLAAELGADVPFFQLGGTAVGTERGDQVAPMPDGESEDMLVVTPNIAVPTAEAFAGVRAVTLTKEYLDNILPVCRSEAESLDLRHTVLINDLEKSVFDSYPEIARVKQALLDLGAVNAAMSGSGASVFAIFDKKETRQAAEKALDHESTWRKFVVATISRSEYREALRC